MVPNPRAYPFLLLPPSPQRRHPDGKEERWLRDGRHVINFNNGTKRTVHADGRIVVAFANGDVKQTYVDGLVIYYYAEAATTHTTRPDGVELFDFPNGQQEKHHPNGLKVITFADETVKQIQEDVRAQSTPLLYPLFRRALTAAFAPLLLFRSDRTHHGGRAAGNGGVDLHRRHAHDRAA